MNVAVFLPNWVGDVVMATPTLRALRRHFHEARLVGILRPGLADLLAGTAWLDELWPFDPRAPQRDVGRLALVRRMRRQPVDLAVLLTNSLHTAFLAWLGGARRRLGYARSGRGLLLTQRLQPLRHGRRYPPVPMVDYYLALAQAAGCGPESQRLELAASEADEHAAEAMWQALGLSQRVIGINAGGAYGSAKRWPARQAADVARRLVDELDHDVLVLGGPRERAEAQEIVDRAGGRRVFLQAAEPSGLGMLKACLRRLRLLVSTDSGPRHMAAALGTPVVTLLGSMSPTWLANPTVAGVNVSLDLECIGCSRRQCPLGHQRCMQELGPAQVLPAVRKLLRDECRVSSVECTTLPRHPTLVPPPPTLVPP